MNTPLFIRIDKEEFIDWRYSDREDQQELFSFVRTELKKDGRTAITLDDIYRDCGYIPSWLVINPSVIPTDRKTDIDEDTFEFEPHDSDVISWERQHKPETKLQ
jgi:hypothetical protein